MVIERIKQSFRRLQWKITLSYAAVTVGSLLLIILILGYLLFSKIFLPIEIYNKELTPEKWMGLVRENSGHIWRSVLSQDPTDTRLISTLLQESSLEMMVAEILQVGDFRIVLRTDAQGSFILVDPDGILLGTYNSDHISEDVVGQPLDLGILPGLEESLKAALSGVVDPERLFVTLDSYEQFYFTFPILDEINQNVLGAFIIKMEGLPTDDDIPELLMTLLGQSILTFLIAAGVVSTIFGALTASGMVKRFELVSQATDAWSQGDFSGFIDDNVGDEISQLAVRLNRMAEQLQQLLKRSQEIAVSEERNRLARDLHDSAKQEALAASFHLGTALTLFERDPEDARSHLVEADNLVDSVRTELTDLIHELRPPSMNGGTFEEIINDYIIDWAHQTGIEADLDVDGMIDLPLETKQAIYRIMQEGLANVARHSSAGKVDITLHFDSNSVEFCISDNGTGFDILQQTEGMGLNSMRERVESLQGDFKIESEIGNGTKVCLTIPLE